MNLKSSIDGEKLRNNTKHTGKTNSVGFCFLDLKEYRPIYAFHFLVGAVETTDICVIFETNEKLNKTYGIYAVPGGAFFDSFQATEYCIEEYDNTKFKMIKYSVGDFYKDRWKWNTEYNQELLKDIPYLQEQKDKNTRLERAIQKALDHLGVRWENE